MSRLIVRTVGLALAFVFVLPHIPGFTFTGQFFPDALLYAVAFAVTAWVVNFVAYLAVGILAIGTLGLALAVLWPIRVLGWWLLAAYQLHLLADLFPGQMAVHGWQPALLAGLVVMFVNMLTNKWTDDLTKYS